MKKRRVFLILAVVAALGMFGSAAHSAQIPWENLWPSDPSRYDAEAEWSAPDWVYMRWGGLREPITTTAGEYTVTARGTGTDADPYRFEVSPPIPSIPAGSFPSFSSSYPWRNLLEFGDWIRSLPQPQRSQVPEPSVLAMLLLGLAGVSIGRRKFN